MLVFGAYSCRQALKARLAALCLRKSSNNCCCLEHKEPVVVSIRKL